MKKFTFIILIIIMTAWLAVGQEDMNDLSGFDDLKGTYLGQKPLGKTPELFADGIIANKYESFQRLKVNITNVSPINLSYENHHYHYYYSFSFVPNTNVLTGNIQCNW